MKDIIINKSDLNIKYFSELHKKELNKYYANMIVEFELKEIYIIGFYVNDDFHYKSYFFNLKDVEFIINQHKNKHKKELIFIHLKQ